MEQKKTIIAVDNDDLHLNLMRHIIARLPGLVFVGINEETLFLDYMNGVEQGVHPMPASVFIDINLPSMFGFELVARVRENPVFATKPRLVLLSGFLDRKRAVLAMKCGSDAVEEKPLEIQQWEAMIKRSIGE